MVPDEEDVAWYLSVRWITGISIGLQYDIGDEDDEYSHAIILDLLFIGFALVFNK